MHQAQKFLSIFSIFCAYSQLFAQPKPQKVLFLGNSYTAVNNLPQLLKDMALFTGDTLITDQNTPGGFTLMGHSTNSASLSRINAEKWDYVVLQDQSQLPSFPEPDVQQMVYPYARALDSLIDLNHSCTKTVFYMTWGRKNGDAQNCPSWPPVCTYRGMDSLLALRYRKMADDNKALLSPVGAVWKYLRSNNPGIELYQSDESHPTVAGSYAAACCFYAVILGKDPTQIQYTAGLTGIQAEAIREAAKAVVYQKLSEWNVGIYEPKAKFTPTFLDPKTVQFQNTSTHSDRYLWDFGDGDTSTMVNPQHTYKSAGKYAVKLTAFRCDSKGVADSNILISSTGVSHFQGEQLIVFPNPTTGLLHIAFPEAFLGLSYQLCDAAGKVVLREKIQTVQSVISTESLPAGIYTLQVSSVNRKIVKE
jgi:hypothetical protein